MTGPGRETTAVDYGSKPSPRFRVLNRAALLYHPRKERAVEVAEWLAPELQVAGVQVEVGSAWEEGTVDRLGRAANVVVALGGDGTIIHVARLLAACSVPVLGVNLGRVGFLAEVTPEGLKTRVEALIRGDYWVERRAMLDVSWQDRDVVERFHCLNEVAVARGASTHSIRVAMELAGEPFLTYTADAVLVSTATGSTAYSLAAGGPILYPEARDILVTPVAPHLHIGRSVVLPASAVVTLRLVSERPAIMSVDGTQERVLGPHHVVEVRAADASAHFARFGPSSYFYRAIAQRLK